MSRCSGKGGAFPPGRGCPPGKPDTGQAADATSHRPVARGAAGWMASTGQAPTRSRSGCRYRPPLGRTAPSESCGRAGSRAIPGRTKAPTASPPPGVPAPRPPPDPLRWVAPWLPWRKMCEALQRPPPPEGGTPGGTQVAQLRQRVVNEPVAIHSQQHRRSLLPL